MIGCALCTYLICIIFINLQGSQGEPGDTGDIGEAGAPVSSDFHFKIYFFTITTEILVHLLANFHCQ